MPLYTTDSKLVCEYCSTLNDRVPLYVQYGKLLIGVQELFFH